MECLGQVLMGEWAILLPLLAQNKIRYIETNTELINRKFIQR